MILGRASVVMAVLVASLELARGSPRVTEAIDVAKVWSGHPVEFALITAGNRQYVAYYDAERRLTVAARRLGKTAWTRQVLPSRVGWDSHNGIVLAVDRAGCLHLSGNMHVTPLVYFRTIRPHDVTSFERVPNMVGREEGRCTYPRFLEGSAGRLVFTYRDGESGRGRRLFNVYDESRRRWQRLLESPLLDGLGKVNAYPIGPSRGPDGRFHLVWMWRDTPDCRTNHDISYARSRDLVRWETAGGKRLTLPLTPDARECVVDPVPSRAGLINMGFGVGFDARKRPVIHYHRYDDEGHSQIYNARFEGREWRIVRTSSWRTRWDFGGGGAIACEVRGSPVTVLDRDHLAQAWSHVTHGAGRWKLDAKTLKPVADLPPDRERPPELDRLESEFPGMAVRWASDRGSSSERGARYVLRWETLPVNRDRPRSGPLPAPAALRVYRIAEE